MLIEKVAFAQILEREPALAMKLYKKLAIELAQKAA